MINNKKSPAATFGHFLKSENGRLLFQGAKVIYFLISNKFSRTMVLMSLFIQNLFQGFSGSQERLF